MVLETIWALLFIGFGLFAGGVAFNEHRRLKGHAASQNLPLYHMVACLLIYIGVCFVWSETVGRAATWLDRVPMGKRMSRTAFGEIAAAHLRASGNPAIMSGDERLAHEVAELAGMPHEGWKTTKKVLDRLEGSRLFEKVIVAGVRGRRCRCFNLRTMAPDMDAR
jgi:hypothetical protein